MALDEDEAPEQLGGKRRRGGEEDEFYAAAKEAAGGWEKDCLGCSGPGFGAREGGEQAATTSAQPDVN